MPADDGFWLDQNEMAPPSGVDAPDRQPEDPINGLEVGARTRTEGDLELMAKEQVLYHKVLALREEPCQCREEDAEYLEHPGRVADLTGSSFALHQVSRCQRPAGQARPPPRARASTDPGRQSRTLYRRAVPPRAPAVRDEAGQPGRGWLVE